MKTESTGNFFKEFCLKRKQKYGVSGLAQKVGAKVFVF